MVNNNRWYLLLLTLLLALGVSACQSDKETLARINEATFIATEYAYQGPESIPAGWARLTLDNQGTLPHSLYVVSLPEGKTTDDLLAEGEDGAPEWTEFYGSVVAEPGQRASYVVELTAGNYALFSAGGDDAQGMIDTLTVTAAQGEVAKPDLPQADAEVSLLDFAFAVSGKVGAGEQSLKLVNAGQEPHAMLLFKMHAGKTLADFRAILDKELNGETVEGEMPFEQIGGTFLSPGVTNYVTQDFEPGTYVLFCPLPSPAHEGQMHAALGMLAEVIVQ